MLNIVKLLNINEQYDKGIVIHMSCFIRNGGGDGWR